MKLTITSLLFLITITFSNAQEFKTPVDYLNYIGKETDAISRTTWKYTSAVAHSKNARRIDVTRKTLVKSIQNATKKIEALKDGYKGDVEYKEQLLAYLSISEKQINQEYEKIINMQEVAEQSYDFMEAFILARDLVNAKINEEVNKLNANQKIFANKYGIQIGEDKSELGKKMKISNEVFENHTQLFLIFFKVNFTESLLMNAIAQNNLNAIQQNSNALEQYSNEGLDKLKTFKAFNNDLILVNATKKVLEFSKKEALEFSPKVVAFMMLNQKFQESKKTMDNKSATSRSKEEVDNFNKLVNELNKEVGNYNAINNKFNSERANAINFWNVTGDTFISKHVPID
ncbi:LIC11966 family surface protein [Flavobacterium sp. XS1P27]|uniref:LIC11966 family surface protein n=1 Tax=Flavobacterium sp. XS1P27 TaxID=3401724 RepID=UPI003AAB9FA1